MHLLHKQTNLISIMSLSERNNDAFRGSWSEPRVFLQVIDINVLAFKSGVIILKPKEKKHSNLNTTLYQCVSGFIACL